MCQSLRNDVTEIFSQGRQEQDIVIQKYICHFCWSDGANYLNLDMCWECSYQASAFFPVLGVFMWSHNAEFEWILNIPDDSQRVVQVLHAVDPTYEGHS